MDMMIKEKRIVFEIYIMTSLIRKVWIMNVNLPSNVLLFMNCKMSDLLKSILVFFLLRKCVLRNLSNLAVSLKQNILLTIVAIVSGISVCS